MNFTSLTVRKARELIKKKEITKPFGLAHEHIDRNIGLGLNYVQTFTDLHHAKLSIVSENKKTTVSLSFNL